MPSVLARAALVATVILSLGTVACGADDKSAASASGDDPVTECRDQWSDVAANLVGLDEDPHPSAMAERWENVLGTVAIYADTKTADRCQENVETISTGITDLRQFTTRLQPYDMEYQTDQVADAVSRYVSEPLPAPVRKGGKLVKPPTKLAVTAALATLTAQAATANADLAPPWAQLTAITLDDEEAVAGALQDLDDFAKESSSWVECNQALKVIQAAIAAQGTASPDASPSASASTTPSSSPSASPSTSPTATPSGSATP